MGENISYKRCTGGGDCGGKATVVVKAGGKKGNPDDEVYQCTPPAASKTPCPAGTCGCYIVATKHGPLTGFFSKGIDDAILEEVFYPCAPDTTKKGAAQYDGMLTEAIKKAKHSPAGKTFWNINCTCLDTAGGSPAYALSVILTIPGHAYASTMKSLEKKFGRENVELAVVPYTGPGRRGAKKASKKQASNKQAVKRKG